MTGKKLRRLSVDVCTPSHTGRQLLRLTAGPHITVLAPPSRPELTNRFPRGLTRDPAFPGLVTRHERLTLRQQYASA
jgi:hypothetical protein